MPHRTAPGEPRPELRPEDLEARLAAERAAVEHWRRVARQRSAEFAALSHRPLVRALLGLERRLSPVAGTTRRTHRRLGALAARAGLGAGALRRAGRRRAPGRLAADLPAAPGPLDRRVLAVVVGPADAAGPVPGGDGVEVVRVASPGEVGAAVGRRPSGPGPDLVAIVAGTTEPLEPACLARLAAAVGGRVVAAAPLVVHPVRPLARATGHDGLVRAAGVGLRLDERGAPQAVAVRAGTTPRPGDAVAEVDATTGAAVLVERAAFDAAGGLAVTDDLDAAVIELCARLRAAGGQVVLVPGAVVVDHRPVASRRDLVEAAGGPGWEAAVHRSGPVLRRAADPRPHPPRRVALTTAVPSARLAPRWGDWHLAQALATGLRGLDVEPLVQTADLAGDLAARSCDVRVVLRGLHPVDRSRGQRHVLWIISHPESVDDDELDAADLVLVASPRFAEHLRTRTGTPVEVLLQATDHRRFTPRPVDPAHRHDVTVVAKTRDVLRPGVADALAAGLRPRIYGGGWGSLVDPDLVVADHVDNDVLPSVYSSAGVVLNDHWGTMRAWGFVSNRIFDVLACSTPVISDAVDGLDELFEGAVLQYRTPEELRRLVDEVLADPARARERAAAGRRIVLDRHTMDHRAAQLLDALARWSDG